MSQVHEPDLWSFIQNVKAIEHASMKRLQSFVLLLSKKELKHMIKLYLQSAMMVDRERNGLTLYQSVNKLKNSNHETNSNVLDTGILNKMNKDIGKKYEKKIFKNLQQNHHNDKTNLLSINPQILASSFQYLSFKELCQILPTCNYFLYIDNSYKGLCHHYIKLNQKFWVNVFRSKINLQMLQQFKHIAITHSYCGKSNYDAYVEHKSYIFERILRIIINKSSKCLDTLEIDIQCQRGRNIAAYFTLQQIINFFETPSNLTNLIWKRDHGYGVEGAMKTVASQISTKFPRLTQLTHGFGNGVTWTLPEILSESTKAGLSCFRDLTFNFSNKLTSINLNCPHFNVYKTDYQIISNLSQIKTLQRLTICSLIDVNNIIGNIKNKYQNSCLETLNVEFVMKRNDATNHGPEIEYITTQLLSSFVNISSFSFQHSLRFHWRDRRSTLILPSLCIDWMNIFQTLFQQKRMHGLNANSINPLSALQISLQQEDIIAMFAGLIHYNDEIHFQIERIKLNVLYQPSMTPKQSEFDEFVNDYLIPYMRLKKPASNLKSMDIGFGTGFKQYCSYTLPFQIRCNRMRIWPLYMNPVINLLGALPKSLIECKISLPRYNANIIGSCEIRKFETMKLVKKLCELLSQSTNESNLNSITLDRIRFSKETEKYVIFTFGFNDKIFIKKDTYHLYLK